MKISTAAALLVVILSSSTVYANENDDRNTHKQEIYLTIEGGDENRPVEGPQNARKRAFSVKTDLATHVSDVTLRRDIVDSETTATETPFDDKDLDSSDGKAVHPTYKLSIDGHDLTFYLSKLEDREEFPVTHYFGSLEDSSYVLLSVDRFSDALVGTVSFGGDVYRLIGPGPTDSLDSIYRVTSDSDRLRSKSFHGLIDKQLSDPKLYDMERSHLKQVTFVEMGTTFSAEYTDELVYSVTARGQNLGVVDLYAPPENIPKLLADYFSSIEPLSGLSGDELFRVESITGAEYSGYTIYFRQIIDGVPVSAHNWVEIEAFTGYVKAIEGLFVSDVAKSYDVSEFIPEAKVRGIIEGALISESERLEDLDVINFSYQQDELSKYFVVEDGGELKIMYQYKYTHYDVIVDGLSGEVEVVDREEGTGGSNLFRDTCRQSGSTHPTVCPSNPAPHVLKETTVNTKVCLGGSYCDNRHDNVWNVINQTRAEWAVADSSSCCAGAGDDDNRVGVIINSARANYKNVTLWGPNSLIHIPSKGQASAHKSNVEVAYDSQVVAHEFGHGVIWAVNSSLAGASGYFADALVEAYADVIAAQVSMRMLNTSTPYTSSPWNIGSYSLVPGLNRNMAISTNFSQLNPSADEYANAKVFGNFFYRISKKSGITVNQMGVLVYKSLKAIKKSGGASNSAWDIEDLKTALLSAASGDTALKNAVNSAWDQMNVCENPLVKSGGQGTFNYTYDLSGRDSHSVHIAFEAFSIPDSLTVKAGSSTIATTNGAKSGYYNWTVNYNPATQPDEYKVNVIGGGTNTAWKVCLACSSDLCDDELDRVNTSYSFYPGGSWWNCPSSYRIDGISVSIAGTKKLTKGNHVFSLNAPQGCLCTNTNIQTCINTQPTVTVKGTVHSLMPNLSVDVSI